MKKNLSQVLVDLKEITMDCDKLLTNHSETTLSALVRGSILGNSMGDTGRCGEYVVTLSRRNTLPDGADVYDDTQMSQMVEVTINLLDLIALARLARVPTEKVRKPKRVKPTPKKIGFTVAVPPVSKPVSK